jgi:hypothetical protein
LQEIVVDYEQFVVSTIPYQEATASTLLLGESQIEKIGALHRIPQIEEFDVQSEKNIRTSFNYNLYKL